MDKHLQMQQELHKQRTQVHENIQTEAQHDHSGHCHNCGAEVAPGTRFCENCGAPQGCNCISCGATLQPNTAICPVCGHPATAHCTFCGSEMSAGQAFCPECGNPRGGITCPECGTLNYRSFCRKCNHPLNPMALYAIEQVRRDPRYIRAQAIADEMQQIENEMEQLEAILAQPEPVPEENLDATVAVSDETRRMLDEFARLTSRPASQPKPAQKPQQQTEESPDLSLSLSTPTATTSADITVQRKARADASARLEQLKAQHRAKLEEFKREIDAMIPNPNDPPEIQRNFACAQIITTYNSDTRIIKKKQRVAWVCNRCHIRHTSPADCGVAQFGGQWIYETRTETITVESTNTNSIKI